MQKLLCFGLLFAAGTIAFFTLVGSYGLSHLQALEHEEQALRQKNRKLRADIVKLRNRLYAVQKDNYSLEKSVRTELGMAKPGEIIYVFPPSAPE